MSASALFLAASASLFSWSLLRILMPHLVRSLLDQPNSRSSHSQPTPRGGGVVFVLVAFACSTLALVPFARPGDVFDSAAGLPIVALPLACVGLLDDRFNLPAAWRYSIQVATALGLILLSPLPLLWQALPLLLIAVTAVINFTNFMDGLDGLLAGCMVIALATVASQLSESWTTWGLVGGLLGFLLWNWSPAQVFMGDVGSTFLGAVFAGLVLQASTWPEALTFLLVATPLLADACLCVVRRLTAGQPVFEPHRLHLYQRLNQAGWSHAKVASTYLAATAAMAFALFYGGLQAMLPLAVLEVLVGIWLDQRVALPFADATSRHLANTQTSLIDSVQHPRY